VVLGYETWQRLFGEDRSIIGKSVTINRTPRVVVGVMPKEFRFAPCTSRSLDSRAVVGRVHRESRSVLPADHCSAAPIRDSGAILRRARGDCGSGCVLTTPNSTLDCIWARRCSRRRSSRTFGTRLFVLMGAVGFLLLITCANLANLTLAARVSASW
jgi:hypothetical protein